MDYVAALKTIIGVAALAVPEAGTALAVIQNLANLAATAEATAEDAKRAYDLIAGHVDGTADLDALETEIEALEARGLKPVDPPEN